MVDIPKQTIEPGSAPAPAGPAGNGWALGDLAEVREGAAAVRFRPRGVARRVAAVLAPATVVAGRVAAERGFGQRRDRLVAAARDGLSERRHPTRPRMRALVVSGGARLTWRDVPAPPPPDGRSALVRPIAVATCDLDRPLALGATPFPLPLGIGHECVAEVLEVGPEVRTVRPGQRVCVPFQISCGECVPCRGGLTSNCAAVPPLSMYGFGLTGGHWGGALADRLAVPFADAMLVPLPEGMDPVAAASVSDTICDGYRHIGRHLPALLHRDPDSDVLVVAALRPGTLFSASLPLYSGQVALALGARRVRLVDARPHVRAAADRLGIETLRPEQLRGSPPATLVVAATATAPGMWTALRLTAPDGVCSSVGGLHRVGRVPVMQAYGRNLSFHIGRTHARALMPEVLELMATGRFRPEQVITTRGALDDAPRLLGRHYRTGDIKTVLSR
jgi:alcohol dehydrogenase